MKVFVRIKKAVRVIRQEGMLRLLVLSLQKVENDRRKSSKSTKIKLKIRFLAAYEDVIKAKWVTKPYSRREIKKSPPFTINWVMSPPRSGGGHQNIFRFIQYLESKGHTCRVYLYSSHDFISVAEVRSNLEKSSINTKAEITWLDGHMRTADAVFATGWETAYPVFNDNSEAKKFYFVQDFEPYFYPLSSEYKLAENTYRMNFYGITAGGWLDDKLSNEYGMSCDHYDFGTDTNLYRFENSKTRKEIFFYARPVTARRGFELGIMALQLFHEQKPDYTITLAGWDVADYHIPFPYKNLKTLSLGELSEIYNRCAAGLVISLTNMSLLPLELLSAGAIPVVNDGPNNTKVSNNPFIKFAPSSPDALAQALVEVVGRKDLPKYAQEGAASVKDLSWEKSCQKFEEILKRELNG